MHGGAKGSGAPAGPRNGNYRHGQHTREAIAERRMPRTCLKATRGLICAVTDRDEAS
jgi:hypothetical protein